MAGLCHDLALTNARMTWVGPAFSTNGNLQIIMLGDDNFFSHPIEFQLLGKTGTLAQDAIKPSLPAIIENEGFMQNFPLWREQRAIGGRALVQRGNVTRQQVLQEGQSTFAFERDESAAC